MSRGAPLGGVVGPLGVWSLAVVVGAGVLAGPVGAGGLVTAAVTATAGLAAALVGQLRVRGQRRASALMVLAVTLVGAAVGGIRVAGMEAGPLAQLVDRSGTSGIVGTVAAEPRVDDDRWWTLLRVTSVERRATRQHAFLRGEGAPPVLGSRWSGPARVRALPDGGFGRYLRSMYAVAEVRPVAGRWERTAAPGHLLAATEHVRARVRQAAASHLPASHAGIGVGLVTGDTRLLPAEDEEALRATGLSHLIAVSGANVALVLAGTLLLLRLLPVGAATRRALLVAVLVWFVLLTRWEPSVVRAGVMAAIVLLCAGCGRLPDPRHALPAAVLVVILIDPGAAGSLGLLLSAAATAGVLLVAPAVGARLARRHPRLPAPVVGTVATSVGAQVAVMPVLLAGMGEVPVSSVPANLVAVPAAALGSAICSVAALAAVVAPEPAGWLFALARPPLGAILAVGRNLEGWGGAVAVARPLTVLAAGALVVWLLARPRSSSGRVALACLLLAVLVLATPALRVRTPVRTLAVTAIDVGQGDAFLVETPDARVLVDGGPDDRAASWLRRVRPGRLDLVILSHPHEDHAAGLPAVLTTHRAGAIWLPDLPADDGSTPDLLGIANDRGVPVVPVRRGHRAVVGALLLEVLGPPAGRPYRTASSEPNEMSLVVRASWGGRVALLPGDAEREAQRDLLRAPHELTAGFLKVPHHGGDTSEPAFLRAVGAEVAAIGVGRNSYGHPTDAVLDVLAEAGTRIVRTDRDGTVRVDVPATGAEVSPTRQPPARNAARPAVGPRVGSPHARSGPPRQRGRRPPAPPGGGARPRSAPHRAPRPRGRVGGRRDRGPPPRRAHRLALRRAALPARAQRRAVVGRAGRRGPRPARLPTAGGRARARCSRHRTDPHDREAGGGGGRAHRREDPAAVEAPGVGGARPLRVRPPRP